MLRRLLALVVLLAVPLTTPLSARAGGFEFSAPGTRALGRGGAFMARADDPMALGYNPAGLAFLPGYQLQLGSHVTFYDSCVQRSGSYGDSGFGLFDSRFGDPAVWSRDFPRVCNGGLPSPSPQLVFSAHPIPELGFAVGLLAPAGVANVAFGNADGTIDVDGVSLPSPTRYMLVEQNLLLFHPSIGVGYSPAEFISFGVTLQWGIAIVDFTNHTSAGSGYEDPAEDVRTDLSVTDFFVPAVIASVHVVPIDEMDIVAMARFSDSIDADGNLGLTTGTFGTSGPLSYAPYRTDLPGTTLHAGQPWQFGLSVRYADRRERRFRDPDQAGRITARVEDRMQNENFDLELDVVYQLNTQVTDFVVGLPEGAEAGLCEEDNDCSGGPTLSAPLPGTLPIAKGWQDQVAIRVGGDWNAVPGVFAVRGGAHFETSGFNGRYAQPDFIPGMRLGLHLGATLRIERFDISIAYAHIFQFDETVAATDANYRLVAAQDVGMSAYTCREPYDSSRPVSSDGCYPRGFGSANNAGTYSAEFNVISLSARYHFE